MHSRLEALDGSPDGRTRRPHLALVGVSLLALVLRLYKLDAESLWMDELVTVQTYVYSPWQIVQKAADEGQPPLDNWIGGVMARLGLSESDWWIRFPPAVFGSASVFLLGWWVSRIGGALPGLLAAMLLCACPLHVYLSQEARPYALFVFLVLCVGTTFQWAWGTVSVRRWSLFSFLLWCCLMSRWVEPNFVAASLAALTLVELVRTRSQVGEVGRQRRSDCVRSGLAILAAYAMSAPFAWIVFLHSPRALAVQGDDRAARWLDHLVQAFASFFHGYSTRTLFRALPGPAWVLLLAGSLVGIGLVAAARRCWSRQALEGTVFWSIMIPFPFAYALLFSTMGNAMPKPQYLVLGCLPVFALIALGIEEVRGRIVAAPSTVGRLATGTFLAALAIPMLGATWTSFESADKRDWRGLVGHLARFSTSADAVAVVASDTVPSSYHTALYGRLRYGPEVPRPLNLTLDANMLALDDAPWTNEHNTVWIVGYVDRMYSGFDQVSAPTEPTLGVRVHRFNGLFLLEITGPDSAADRLARGLTSLYESLPDHRSLVAPAVVLARWHASRGQWADAACAQAIALRQCASDAEATTLRTQYFDLSAYGQARTSDELELASREEAHP